MEIKQFHLNGGNSSGLPRVPPQPAEILDSDEPQQFRHHYFHDEARKLRAGVWACSAFATKLIEQKSHESVLVADGEVIIADEEGREHAFGVGDYFVIPGGMKRRWIHKKLATVYFVSYEDGRNFDSPRIVTVDPNGSLAPSTPPAADVLMTPTPRTHIRVAYENPAKIWSAGVWDATPYHRKKIPFPRYEFMHLLDGEVSFNHQDGKTKRFKKGDSFLVPPGVVADWHNEVYVRKYFAVFRPPAS
jgi:uncharacterized cupin superfamily protein